MRNISVKLGVLLSALFFSFVSIMGLVVYNFMENFYLKQVTNELLHRGHSHAIVLSNSFDEQTVHHVALMEEAAVTMVAILDNEGHLLKHSDQLTSFHENYLKPFKNDEPNSWDEELIETNWRTKPDIVARSPIIKDNQLLGTVIMFLPTDSIRDAIHFLKEAITGIILASVLIGILLLFLFSNMITKPLVRMKEATQKIAKGRYATELSIKGKDEMADLAQSINQLAKGLQHFEQTRNDFLADISHELRTPLTYLKGYSEILSKDTIHDEEEKKQYLKIIHDEAIRVFNLVQDLFELTKLEGSNVTLKKIDMDMVELVEGVLTRLEPAFDISNIELELSTIPKLLMKADPQRMEQVFFNLLDNARRYTPSGGKVVVTIGMDKYQAILTVSDNGIGIPEEELSFIWNRLYRVEKSRSRETGGSGLGLSIVKKIIELHEGHISVESYEGEGTIFIIQLPYLIHYNE